MKAVRLHEYGGPENLRYESDVPDPTVTADSVLVEAAATAHSSASAAVNTALPTAAPGTALMPSAIFRA